MRADPPLSTANAFKVWCTLKYAGLILTVRSFSQSLGGVCIGIVDILRAWDSIMFSRVSDADMRKLCSKQRGVWQGGGGPLTMPSLELG